MTQEVTSAIKPELRSAHRLSIIYFGTVISQMGNLRPSKFSALIDITELNKIKVRIRNPAYI